MGTGDEGLGVGGGVGDEGADATPTLPVSVHKEGYDDEVELHSSDVG